MKNILFMLGFMIGVGIGSFIIGWVKDRYDYRNSLDRWAKRLSKDKPFERINMGSYIIYANGAKWELEAWVGCKLVWFAKYGPSVEYQATWLPERVMKRSVKHIIFHHPNLKNKNDARK